MRAAATEADGDACHAAVLAGGRGSRLGGGKPTTMLGGRPLIEHVVSAAEAAGLRPLVVAKPDTDLPSLGCRVLLEPATPTHPLCGLVAGLRHVGRPLIALPCDMPFVPAGLLRLLAACSGALVVPALGGCPQPFPGRYAPALLTELEAAMRREDSLRRTIGSLRPRLLGEQALARFGDPRRLAFNVNDKRDLELAEALLHG